jgi:integrase
MDVMDISASVFTAGTFNSAANIRVRPGACPSARSDQGSLLLNSALTTCGRIFNIPCVTGNPRHRLTVPVGRQATRDPASNIKLPHVRDYLRPEEANAVIAAAAKLGRNGLRDQVLLRLMYRHGLRASEATNVRWTDFDLATARTP